MVWSNDVYSVKKQALLELLVPQKKHVERDDDGAHRHNQGTSLGLRGETDPIEDACGGWDNNSGLPGCAQTRFCFILRIVAQEGPTGFATYLGSSFMRTTSASLGGDVRSRADRDTDVCLYKRSSVVDSVFLQLGDLLSLVLRPDFGDTVLDSQFQSATAGASPVSSTGWIPRPFSEEIASPDSSRIRSASGRASGCGR